ncbi:glycosyltransferase [Verrucomicrobia bacterium]|nr:glycosyltransferase [Verrucomicrobiota bacterium]
MPKRLKVIILSDQFRGSYHILGNLYERCLSGGREVIHLPSPQTKEERKALDCRGAIVLHNTLGEGFVPITGCHNVAMPLHEWSEYPHEWIGYLNEFDEIWASTDHIREVLVRGGLKATPFLLPPSLDQENFVPKDDWKIEGKPSFLFVGEPHFRKGNHLLIHGYLKAFPNPDQAHLTIKTSPGCPWDSPRKDITVIKEGWERERLLSEYRRHDCFVSASLGEGLGLPVAEAIMSGLPVCANFWGGHTSLLQENNFVRIEHEEMLQPYSSDPKFYAEGQKCAFSSPDEVKKALLQFLALTPEQKERVTVSAREHLSKRYGSPQAKVKILNRISEIEKANDS